VGVRGTRASLAAVAALAGAEAAVALLRPRQLLPAPATVQATSYFSPQEIDRARRFRRPQLGLGLASTALGAALLAGLLARPPARVRGRPRRPVAAAALTGAALSARLGAATLPLAAIARGRAVRVGLVTQGWRGWAADVAKSGAIGAALAGAGAGGAVALMRARPRDWWLPGAGLATAAGVLFATAGPVVLDPLFNRFTPLADGQARDDVLELAAAAGVRVGEVYAVDASRRTTAANAYVAGLGATKRVVLFDTLLESFSRDELRLVVAHELAHVRFRDVPRGLAFLGIVAPGALLAVAETTAALSGEATPGPRTVPALALAAGLVAPPLALAGNRLSRAVERRADRFALALTDAPEPFVSFERRITLRNVADPDPPRWLTAVLSTHPPTLERIGAALAYERERALSPRPAPAAPPGSAGWAGWAGRRIRGGS
jgi:STE24 endopeptidase